MTTDQSLRLRLLMSRQDGVVSLDQALDHGLSREAVRRRVGTTRNEASVQNLRNTLTGNVAN